VQSSLLRALIKENLWQPGTSLRAWLFTILHNHWVSELRRSAREQTSLAEAGISPVMIARSDPSVRLQLIELERAIAELPKGQRQAILLVILEGMRYDDAARILAVPVGTVRSRLGRARAKLRKFVDFDEDMTDVDSTRSAEPDDCIAA
jgi:RNA polymerase sigma-70 factor, ECF subfamily